MSTEIIQEQNFVSIQKGTHIEIAEQIQNICLRNYGHFIYCHNKFWIYMKNYWQEMQENKIRLIIHQFDGLSYGKKNMFAVTKNVADSILNELRVMCENTTFFDNPSVGINCLSGFICFDNAGNHIIYEHSPEHRQKFIIQAYYNEQINFKNSQYLMQLLEGCFKDDSDKEDKINLIAEILASALLGYSTRITQPKAFIFFGNTAENGKTEMIECIKILLPKEVLTSIRPKDFNNLFHVIQLSNSVLNTCTELTSDEIASDIFKGVITGDEISGRYLYKNLVSFYPKALHIFATNTLPSFNGGIDNGIKRRLQIIVFNRKIPKSERIPKITEKIKEHEMDALLNLTLYGTKNLIKNGQYTEPISSQDILHKWEEDTDPIRAWASIFLTLQTNHAIAKRDAYNDFKGWALCEGYAHNQIPSINNFTQRLKSIFPQIIETRDSRTRYYQGIIWCENST